MGDDVSPAVAVRSVFRTGRGRLLEGKRTLFLEEGRQGGFVAFRNGRVRYFDLSFADLVLGPGQSTRLGLLIGENDGWPFSFPEYFRERTLRIEHRGPDHRPVAVLDSAFGPVVVELRNNEVMRVTCFLTDHESLYEANFEVRASWP